MMKNIGQHINELIPRLMALAVIIFVFYGFYGLLRVQSEFGISMAEFKNDLFKNYFAIMTFQVDPRISEIVVQGLWRSAFLLLGGVAFAVMLAFLLVWIQFMVPHSKVVKSIAKIISLASASVPGFLLALTIWFVLRILLGPAYPQGELPNGQVLESLRQFFIQPSTFIRYLVYSLPVFLALAFGDGTFYSIYIILKEKLLEHGKQGYTDFLLLNGYSKIVVFFKHVIPTAFSSLSNYLRTRFPIMLGTLAVVEMMFDRMGFASIFVNAAVRQRMGFEEVLFFLWVFGLISLSVQFLASISEKNHSSIVIRLYYPPIKRVYHAVTGALRKYALLILFAFFAFNVPNVYASLDFGIDTSSSSGTLLIHWKSISNALWVTLLFASIAVMVALVIGFSFGVILSRRSKLLKFSLVPLMEAIGDYIPILILVATAVGMVGRLDFFEGSDNQYKSLIFYSIIFGIFSWSSIAKAISQTINETRYSNYYSCAVAIGCSKMRLILRYHLPQLYKTLLPETLKLIVLVLFIEGAMAFCGGGIDRFSYDLQTLAGLAKQTLDENLILPPYSSSLLRIGDVYASSLLLLAIILSTQALASRKCRKAVKHD